jgi:glycosyltransferase involved in cell wall biosynthesis
VAINIFGLRHEATSWAYHTRQFAAALGRLEDIVVVPYDPPPGRSAPDPNADVAIAVGPIERMRGLTGRYCIGCVVWETTIVPRGKLRVLERLDEVWVPSEWGRAILIENGLSEARVHVVPEGVDPAVFQPTQTAPDSASSLRPSRTDEPPRPFRFLCVGKWEVRKGIDDLARAFAREFAPDEPVELVLHCFNPYVPGFDLGGALERVSLPARARIRTSHPLPLPALAELYRACDVLVLPTKAEGWGLPIIEALACGIPAIATNYSGHTTFLNEANGYLIDVERMIAVNDPFFYDTAEPLGVWAQPNLDHLQALMRRAFANADERRRKGLQARHDVVRHWTWDHAARIAQRRLKGI